MELEIQETEMEMEIQETEMEIKKTKMEIKEVVPQIILPIVMSRLSLSKVVPLSTVVASQQIDTKHILWFQGIHNSNNHLTNALTEKSNLNTFVLLTLQRLSISI